MLSQEALDEAGVEYSLVDPVAEVESLGSDSSIGGCGLWAPIGPRVQTHSRRRFRRPATGVSGQESLSDSDSEEESRLSPTLGERNFSFDLPGRNDKRTADGGGEDNVDSLNDEEDDCDDSSGGVEEGSSMVSEAEKVPSLVSDMHTSEGAESVISEAVDSDPCDSMSECFHTYLVVRISSSNGLRNATLFSTGKIGRLWLTDILRRSEVGIGLFTRMEETVCDTLYGMTPGSEKVEADEMEEELRVLASVGSGVAGESGRGSSVVGTICIRFVSYAF